MTRPTKFKVVHFDPSDKHKKDLPEGVIGVPSPCADNWNYMGCKFYVNENFLEIFPGDFLFYTSNGIFPCRPE